MKCKKGTIGTSDNQYPTVGKLFTYFRLEKLQTLFTWLFRMLMQARNRSSSSSQAGDLSNRGSPKQSLKYCRAPPIKSRKASMTFTRYLSSVSFGHALAELISAAGITVIVLLMSFQTYTLLLCVRNVMAMGWTCTGCR